MKAKEEYIDAPRETRSKDITVYAVIFLVLLVGAGIFLAVRLLHKPADTALADSKSGIVYDSSAVEGGWDNLSPEEIEARLNEKVAEGMINISANTAPIFEDGSSEGNLMLVNESINNYPQKVQIVRNDTGEQIYAQPEMRAIIVSFIRPTAWKIFSKARLAMFTVANRKTMVE